MPDYVLVSKGAVFDPKKVKKSMKQLQLKVGEVIAEEVRFQLSEFLKLLREERSNRASQLREYVGDSADSYVRDNPFEGAQARKFLTRPGLWRVNVTRGKNDNTAQVVGSLFNLLDRGVRVQSTSGRRVFPIWQPYNRLSRSGLTVGKKVRLKIRRLKGGAAIAEFASVTRIEGFTGYKLYDKAVLLAKRNLIGKTIKSEDGLTQYTISQRVFKRDIVFDEISVERDE